MVCKCAVSHCLSKRGDADERRECAITFHRFPLDPIIRAEWTRRSNKGPDFQPTEHSMICSKHFTLDCYKVNTDDKNQTRRRRKMERTLKRTCLHDDAIPTVFEPHLHSCTAGECLKFKVKCSHCDQFLFSKVDLKNHLSAIHVGYLPFGCEHCLTDNNPSWFATEKSLQLHTVVEHPGLDVKVRPKLEKAKEATLAKMIAKCDGTVSPKKTKAELEEKQSPERANRAKNTRRSKRKQDTGSSSASGAKPRSHLARCRTLSAVRLRNGMEIKKEENTGSRSPSPSDDTSNRESSVSRDEQSPSPEPEVQQKQPRKRGRPRKYKEKTPQKKKTPRKETTPPPTETTAPKQPNISFAEEYLRRTSMPEDIPSYLEQLREEIGEEGMQRKKRKTYKPKPPEPEEQEEDEEICVHETVSKILARSCPKPSIPARFSLGEMLKNEGFSVPDEGTDWGSNADEFDELEVTDEGGIIPDPAYMIHEPETKPKLSVIRSRSAKHKPLSSPSSVRKLLIAAKAEREKSEEQREWRRLYDIEYRKANRVKKRTQTTELLFSCSECQAQVFRTRDHVISTHLSDFMFECGYCQFRGGVHRNMRAHSSAAHPDEPKSIMVNEELEDEVDQKHLACFGFDHRTARFECQLCHSALAFGEKMITHVRSSHVNIAPRCVTCDLILDSVDAYIEHHDLDHPEATKRYKFPGGIELQNFCFPAGSQPVETEFPEKTRRAHCRIGINCLKCSASVPVQHLSDHARAHFPTEVNVPYCCPCCNFFDIEAKVVKTHIKTVHPEMSHATLGLTTKKEILYENKQLIVDCFGFNLVECDECHAPVSFWGLRLHVNSHVDEWEGMEDKPTVVEMAHRCYGAVLNVY